MLSIDHLDVAYGQIRVLKGISLEIGPREIVSLIGSNGAGKTTTLNAISRLLPIEGGRLIFEEKQIGHLEPDEVIRLGIVQVPEGRRIFPFMSVQENLEIGSFNQRARARRIESLGRVFELFPRLAERRKQQAGSMSGGEQQMLAVGRGLMACPVILMLDEPSLGLAPLMVQNIFNVLEQVNQEGTPVLLVEQNVQKSLSLAHRGYVLENGQIVMQGNGRELLQDTYLKKAYLGI